MLPSLSSILQKCGENRNPVSSKIRDISLKSVENRIPGTSIKVYHKNNMNAYSKSG